ncbi:hypothetical protein OG292_35415 [Streptomyces sp. NBC_01511]|uniref:hypothetical protein n=1 Tax=Streptomyces sp. NBC_01511 TaxID=2903889 RepID=UPI00386B2AD2
MAAVDAMLEELRGLVPLTPEGAAARFAVREWAPGGRLRDGVETSWRRDGVQGWIQAFGGREVDVSFAVWIRDVDESGYFDDVEAVYAEGERVLAGFLSEIEESPLARHLAEAGRTAAAAADADADADADEDGDGHGDEFIAVRRWLLAGRVLTVGVLQHDTDLPVMVVAALREPAPVSVTRGS